MYEILQENNLCTYYQVEPASGNSPDKSIYAGKFAFLDKPELAGALYDFNTGNIARVTLFVPRMHCSSCIWLLENLQRLNEGIVSSEVNFPGRKVSITFHPEKVSLSSIAATMARIGYEPSVSLDDTERKQNQGKISRSTWYKIGVAGFCFGNIMMLSFPEYFSIGGSDSEDLQRTFSLMNFVLALPVLLYSSRDFFSSALAGIRTKHLNIDMPIAAAILMTFLRSVYEVAAGVGPGYFDSMAGIVFFMLIGRAFQDKTFATLSFDRDFKSYFPVAVSVITQSGETQIPVKELQKGMRIRIRNQEVIPADALLMSDRADIDYSFVTGETDAVEVEKGKLIFAGGRLLGASVELEVVKPAKQSYLTQLWNNPAFRKDKAVEERASMVNRINYWFTIGVFILSVGAAAFWYLRGDMQRMLDSTTTILIVACPCILLLAATFTQGHVLRILGRNKFYLKNAFVIEKLYKADTIVFDKTGTLTRAGESKVEYCGRKLTEEERIAVRTLAGQSMHPLSEAIRLYFSDSDIKDTGVTDFKEHAGRGTSGKVGNLELKLGSAALVGADEAEKAEEESRVYLSIGAEVVGYFKVKHLLREGLPELLNSLKKKAELYLLSGDNDSEKERLRQWFRENAMRFRAKPDEKLLFVKQLQKKGKKVIMTGDGLNDAGALQQANVGIAISTNTTHFSPACDAILAAESLPKLDRFLSFCRASGRVVRGSFVLSLTYNFAGLYFALQGELKPVIAAILMPITSILIVSVSSLWTMREAKKRGL